MTCIPSGSLAEKEIMPEMEIFTIFPILAVNIWKSYMWTTKKKINMEVIFEVMILLIK